VPFGGSIPTTPVAVSSSQGVLSALLLEIHMEPSNLLLIRQSQRAASAVIANPTHTEISGLGFTWNIDAESPDGCSRPISPASTRPPNGCWSGPATTRWDDGNLFSLRTRFARKCGA
jgi:hypothetical protein